MTDHTLKNIKAQIKNKKQKTYIICVNMPSHITIGYQLPINITPNFTVPPSIINVDNADHVPLK